LLYDFHIDRFDGLLQVLALKEPWETVEKTLFKNSKGQFLVRQPELEQLTGSIVRKKKSLEDTLKHLREEFES